MQRLPAITRGTALFLDFDGTLADLAPEPEAVRVAHGLVSSLATLYELLDGALAIVSGRRLVDLDHFLTPLRLPAAGRRPPASMARSCAMPIAVCPAWPRRT